jgi:type II secretory ATPase GspE/PulE/Tfp pilus assembly ATPase PilB-like protein
MIEPGDNINVTDVSGDSYVNSIIKKAAEYGASDVHIEPLPSKAVIRFRIDGVLREEENIPRDYLEHVVNHLKVLCNMEIGSVRLPEDGHFSVYLSKDGASKGRQLDVRVSIFPTINGPASVLRILNREEMFMSLADIGFDAGVKNKVRELTFSSYGMILATGPTGSGKTTTLYSLLMEVNRKERNILTLEDPIEMHFDDIRQSQINPDIGFTFARGMKSILRQDPDVLMIGEIRDAETAEHAVQASLAGRAVYSTLHANTTIGGIARLIDMRIERGLIAYAIRGIISQRLVRRICQNCVTRDAPRKDYISFLGLDGVDVDYKRGAGCPRCGGSGYRGRIGVFEVLIFDDTFRAMIVDKASMDELQSYAEKSGMQTLRQNAIERVTAGITTLEEIVRVV